MKLVFLFTAVLIGVSFQQPVSFSQRCFETLPSWSGNFFMVDYAQGKSNHGYIFYNRTEMRVHYTYDSFDGTPDYKRVWLIGRDRKVYTFDGNSGTCTSDELERFPLFGAPPGADYIHDDRLGSYIYNLGVTTDYFRMTTEDGGVYRGFYSPVFDASQTFRMCIPVIESYQHIDTAPTHQANTHFTFMNTTIDYINGLVWDIPRECFQ